MVTKVDNGGGNSDDGTYYGSTTTGSTPRTPVRKPTSPFPGTPFDWNAATSGAPYQAPMPASTPYVLQYKILPDGRIIDSNDPFFNRASAADTQADWDYQRAVTQRFLQNQGYITPTGGATQPYQSPDAPTGVFAPGNNGPGGVGTFSPNPSAATSGTPTPYEYRSWTDLREDERRLFDLLAELYHPSSTGPSWYDQFVADATKVQQRTGIAPDPMNLALKYARERGYDLKPWLEQSPYLSANSVLLEPGSYARGGSAAANGQQDAGGGGYGSYGGGGGGGQVSLTNPTSARGLLLQTMQNVLGRNPTEAEYSTFLQTLNEAQMGNPVTVDTSGDTLVQSGGVDPNMVALEFAQGAEDYRSREASKYYNMFMAALGGAAGG